MAERLGLKKGALEAERGMVPKNGGGGGEMTDGEAQAGSQA